MNLLRTRFGDGATTANHELAAVEALDEHLLLAPREHVTIAPRAAQHVVSERATVSCCLVAAGHPLPAIDGPRVRTNRVNACATQLGEKQSRRGAKSQSHNRRCSPPRVTAASCSGVQGWRAFSLSQTGAYLTACADVALPSVAALACAGAQ